MTPDQLLKLSQPAIDQLFESKQIILGSEQVILVTDGSPAAVELTSGIFGQPTRPLPMVTIVPNGFNRLLLANNQDIVTHIEKARSKLRIPIVVMTGDKTALFAIEGKAVAPLN